MPIIAAVFTAAAVAVAAVAALMLRCCTDAELPVPT